MLNLFFIVAWRNLVKAKLNTLIQLTGLVIGIGCFILIQLYVKHQTSYNQMFSQAKDIYRIDLVRGESKPQALTPLRLANEVKQNFPQAIDTTRISSSSISIKHQQSVYSERVQFVDKNYFNFFDYALLEGDPLTALNAPNSLVLHQDAAVKYFNSARGVIGKRLTINGKEHQITGVIKETLSPTTIPVNILVPTIRFEELFPNNLVNSWTFNATRTFAKLSKNTALPTLTTNISDYYQQRTQGKSSYKTNRVNIEPLLSLHLNNNTTRTLTPSGSAVMVKVFILISLMILILACVNFTNLSTAAAMRRGKEVGVRKALGANKLQLIIQYLAESVLQSAAAVLIALLLVYLLLPEFNQLMNVQINLELTSSLMLQLFALMLIVGISAGSYPAFYLSNLAPAHVLKGLANNSVAGTALRQGLIILQFAIAALLLVASLVVNWQMNHIENMPQGYERNNVIVINRGADIYDAFKNQVIRHPSVEAVTMSHTVPTKATRTSNTVRRPDNMANEIRVGSNPVSYDFFDTYQIQLLAGRRFSKAYVNDAYKEDEQDWQNSTGKIIINKTLANSLGWQANDAIGQLITLGGGSDGLHNHQIIGVTEDSHYINVKNTIAPMIYVLSASPNDLALRWTSIRFNQGANEQTIKDIEKIWLSLDGDLAFKYDWTVDLFNASYRNETLQTKLLNIFTLLAIMVTTIGLFGLAAFTTQRRVKEIAMRKILGASTSQLCFMLVNQFSRLVIFANVIALPIAYFLMQDWLNSFTYRINMPYSTFIIAGTFSLFIAYFTVMGIAYRAATAKPITALQYE